MTRASRAPHLLYIAWGYPPSRGGGVYRALATANAFVAAGWDVTVVTTTREALVAYTGIDESLESRIDSRVEIVRLPFRFPALEHDIRDYGWFRALAPGPWRELRGRLDRVQFPETGYGPWRHTLEAGVERVHRRHSVDLTLATANPNVSFAAAFRLHEKYGVPFVMDYRDAWQLDVFTGERATSPSGRVARWEKRLITAAREAWFVNQPIRDWHARLYLEHAEKFHVVANGYDTELHIEAHPERHDALAPLTFGYIGTVSSKVPVKAFLEGWSDARRRDPELARARAEIHGYLGFYRVPSPVQQAVIDTFAVDDVHYMGPVAKADIAATYERFDALLLILGTGRYVTSGKVYEYVASGLPIVSVHDPGNAATDVLRGYPLWFPVASLDRSDIAAALVAAAAAARTADPATRQRCHEFAQQYRRDRQLEPRVATLTGAFAPQQQASVEVAS